MLVITLTIFVTLLPYCFSSDTLHYVKNHTRIFVEVDATVILNCTCSRQTVTSWYGPQRSTTRRLRKDQGTELYAQGLILTKNLKDLNIDIIGDYSKSICNLIIRDISDVDTGNYTCELWKSGVLYLHKFTLYVKSPQTNLTILNTLETNGKKIIRGIDGQALDLVCNVKSGRPAGTLLLTQNGSNIAMGGSTLVYSFTPTERDNMKLFKCYAFSEILEMPLTYEVTLDIQYKPLLVTDYLEHQEVIENTSLEVCCQGHSNPPITHIYWTGNVTLVVFNDTESCLTFKLIHRTNTGRYTCFTANSIGLSNKSIEINVLSVYTQNVTVYASEGDNVTIKCKLFLNSKSTWDKVKANGKYTVIPYADGDEINTDLPNKQTLAIVGNINEGDYHLQIQNVSFNDDGIYICSQRSNKQRILESYVTLKIIANKQEVFVRSGDTIILNCTCISQTNGNWVGPNRSSSKTNMFKKEQLIPYTEGFRVNRKLNISNINVVGSYKNRTCNLMIKEFSIDDEGTYKCQYVKNHKINNHVYKLLLTNGRTTSPSSASSVDTSTTTTLIATSLVKNTTSAFVEHLSDDDNKYIFVYGYCWILMGSIAAGIASVCGCLHIFCNIKRAKTANNILHINTDGNYDEVETLNYNNTIFDQTANTAELNNDNISSSIESNDIVLSADVVSSDDSSSVKLSVDGYENPYQTINSCDIEIHHYSSIVSSNYQNTMIFPQTLSKNTSNQLNMSMDSLINHWLVIYKRKQ